MTDRITFIGAGNMSRSIIGGLLADGYPADLIRVSDPSDEQRQNAHNDFGVATDADNATAVEGASVVVLGIKPDVVPKVCQNLAGKLHSQILIISIAAGIRSADLERWIGAGTAIVRCMPNTPALLQRGASAYYCNANCTTEHQATAEQIIGAVGFCTAVESDELIDSVTALSGSGPAYFFYLIECMTDAAVELGLDREAAADLAIETAYGAASMARSREANPATLRERVTSKGGTTAAALQNFKENHFPQHVYSAMLAAKERAAELGDLLAGDKTS